MSELLYPEQTHSFPLFNIPEANVVPIARRIDASPTGVEVYRHRLSLNSGLKDHLEAARSDWEDTYSYSDSLAAEAKNGFDIGSLGAYGLLENLRVLSGIPLPIVSPDLKLPSAELLPLEPQISRILEYSGRGVELPEAYAAFFTAALAMYSRVSGEDPAVLRALLESRIGQLSPTGHLPPNLVPLTAYLSGVGEVIVPLEYAAQASGVEQLEKQLALEYDGPSND